MCALDCFEHILRNIFVIIWFIFSSVEQLMDEEHSLQQRLRRRSSRPRPLRRPVWCCCEQTWWSPTSWSGYTDTTETHQRNLKEMFLSPASKNHTQRPLHGLSHGPATNVKQTQQKGPTDEAKRPFPRSAFLSASVDLTGMQPWWVLCSQCGSRDLTRKTCPLSVLLAPTAVTHSIVITIFNHLQQQRYSLEAAQSLSRANGKSAWAWMREIQLNLFHSVKRV